MVGSMLRRAAPEAGTDILDKHATDAWLRAMEAGAAALRRVGDVLSGGEAKGEAERLAEAVRAYRTSVDEMRRSGQTQPLSTAALGRLFGLSFALDQFRRDLDDLLARSTAIAATRRTRLSPLLRNVLTGSVAKEDGR